MQGLQCFARYTMKAVLQERNPELIQEHKCCIMRSMPVLLSGEILSLFLRAQPNLPFSTDTSISKKRIQKQSAFLCKTCRNARCIPDNYLSGETGQISPQLLFNILPGVLATAMKRKQKRWTSGTSEKIIIMCRCYNHIYLGSKKNSQTNDYN